MDGETITLSASSGIVGAAVTFVGNWLVSRSRQRREIAPQPLVVAPAESYARQADLVDLRENNRDEHDNLEDRLRALEATVHTQYGEIQRLLGVLTGKIETLLDR